MTTKKMSVQEQKLLEELKCKEMNVKLCEWALDAGITTFTSGIVVQEKLDKNLQEYREIRDRLATFHVDVIIINAAKNKLQNS